MPRFLHTTSLALLIAAAMPLAAEEIDFGDDSSAYSNDGECDDPRFVGNGMAVDLDSEDIMADATDCSRLFEAQMIRLQRSRDEWDVAECASIDYGDDSSEFANDGDCDDPRFTGPSTYFIMLGSDLQRDATDCRALCASGDVWLK